MRMSLLAACLFKESDAGGKSESPQPYPDRVQNKWTDPVPDGIERAEPTLAPLRNRLTSELAKSRFRHVHTTGPERKAYCGNCNWESLYILTSKDVKSFLIRNIPCLAKPIRNFLEHERTTVRQ